MRLFTPYEAYETISLWTDYEKINTMIVDRNGYRLNVGIILASKAGNVFWGRRIGQTSWQFPQGGLLPHESAKEAAFRELHEEVGLHSEDVKLLGVTPRWLAYRLPKQYIRQRSKPLVIGQKQKWFLFLLQSSEQKIQLDVSETPEFDSWRWIDYWQGAKEVIFFKRQIYEKALNILHPFLEYELKEQNGKET